MISNEPGVDLISDISTGQMVAGVGGDFNTGSGVQPQVLPDDGGQIQPTPGTLPAHLAEAEKRTDPSLRDLLSSAMKPKDEQQLPEQQQAPAAQQQQQQQATEPKPGELGSKHRADGTFKTTEELTRDTAQLQMQQLGQQAAAPPVLAVQPPASMSAAEVQQFTTLPPEMQQYVARTAAGVDAHASSLREYGALQQAVLTPQRVNAWAMNGMTPTAALGQLLALSDYASNDPQGFLLSFAQQRGIDIGRLGEGYVPPDPALTALYGQLSQLQQQVGNMQQGQQDHAMSATISEIERFAAEKDGTGNPLRPYWQDVTADILPFVQIERGNNPNAAPVAILQAAYDRACWGNPAVRAKMQAAVEAQNLAGAEQRRQETARARDASSSITGAPAAQPANDRGQSGNRSLREELTTQFASFRQAV